MTSEANRDDVPWLSEMVDLELRILFSEEQDELARGIRHLLELSRNDEVIEGKLIELIENALDYLNDDAAAAVWSTVILGELESRRAIGVLVRSLTCDADEALQDASTAALLRIGAPALETVMNEVEESESAALNQASYRLLGMVGELEDESLRSRVVDFLDERRSIERRKPRAESALEELAMASARLGDRRQVAHYKEILNSDFGGSNPILQDALEMLEENVDGVPIVSNVSPWEQRYGWVFEEESPSARISRGPSGELTMELGASHSDTETVEEEGKEDPLFWGLSLAGGERPDDEDEER